MHELARWSQDEIDLYAEFLSVEGGAEQRIELALANLTALTANLHRGKGKPARPLSDFIVNADPWKVAPSPVDAAVGSQLDAINRKRNRKG